MGGPPSAYTLHVRRSPEVIAVLCLTQPAALTGRFAGLAAGRLRTIVLVAQIARGLPESTPPSSKVLDLSRECVFCETPHEHGDDVDEALGCHTCGSPLSAATGQRIETAGQRAVERFGRKRKITFYTHWPQRRGFSGRTEDISLHGLRFSTRRDLRAGQRIKIVSDIVEAVAHVTHCERRRRGWAMHCVAGVSFITLRFVQSVGGFVSDRV